MSKPEALPVVLPRVIDLDAIDDVREALIEALQSGPVDVVADAVERVSTNALFMLLSAAQTAQRGNGGFAISRASDVMIGAIDKLGLTPAFAPVLKG